MTAVVLSICIPVYNCGEYLPSAIDSILSQWEDRVEVVVYDGGSTDNTPELMQGYLRPRLRYHRAEARGGIDADLAACVALSAGEYCWLFSGDDVMRPGALAKALEQIHTGSDAILCRHTICDIRMQVQYDHVVLRPPQEPAYVDLANITQRHSWFARAASTEAFFSFLSGIIICRQAWDRGRTNPAFAMSCWAHAERLLALGAQGLRVAYVPEIWLDQRGGNDSFARAGTVNRYRIAIEGYQDMADSLFGHDSFEAFHIRRVLRFEFTLRMFLDTKISCSERPERESRELLDRLYTRLHSDRSAVSFFFLWAYRLTPVWAAAYLRQAIRWLRGTLARRTAGAPQT
jgi:abequosyltransferase